MAIELLVSPNGKNGTPKVWGYDTADPGHVFFGSITSTWQKRKISGNAVTVAQEKRSEGYSAVGQFADLQTAQRFRSAFNEARAKGTYPYVASDAVQRQFALALQGLGFQILSSNAPPQAAPSPVAAPPASQPSKRAKKTFFKSLDAEIKRVNKGSNLDVLDF